MAFYGSITIKLRSLVGTTGRVKAVGPLAGDRSDRLFSQPEQFAQSTIQLADVGGGTVGFILPAASPHDLIVGECQVPGIGKGPQEGQLLAGEIIPHLLVTETPRCKFPPAP